MSAKTTVDKLSGAEIRKMREDLGYTEDQLGEILGADGISISEWESEFSEPALPGAVRLALECLQIHRAFQHPFFATIDSRIAQLQKMNEQSVLDRQEFERLLEA